MDTSSTTTPVMQVTLPGYPKWREGKVREIFDLGDRILMVATDRISAFDCILPNGIPRKGEILTQISRFWFDLTESIVANHCLKGDDGKLPESVQDNHPSLGTRSMIVRKTEPLPIECVVRGYLAGSGWREYQASQSVCGISLPPGLTEADELPEPIFTPASKATSGHDENISFEKASELIGPERAEQVKEISLRLYRFARELARERGIIVADTKFEFGLLEGELLLIDEALTPDSSRFWPADTYQPGGSQSSFDKQIVRDYLAGLDWDRQPPAPSLPQSVISQTQARYLEIYRRLTGREL